MPYQQAALCKQIFHLRRHLAWYVVLFSPKSLHSYLLYIPFHPYSTLFVLIAPTLLTLPLLIVSNTEWNRQQSKDIQQQHY